MKIWSCGIATTEALNFNLKLTLLGFICIGTESQQQCQQHRVQLCSQTSIYLTYRLLSGCIEKFNRELNFKPCCTKNPCQANALTTVLARRIGSGQCSDRKTPIYRANPFLPSITNTDPILISFGACKNFNCGQSIGLTLVFSLV
eukprot:sb/3473974/